MLVDDFLDVVLVHVGVPGLLGIAHHHRVLLAAVEAASLVDANLAGTAVFQFLEPALGVIAQLGCTAAVAALLALLALVQQKNT